MRKVLLAGVLAAAQASAAPPVIDGQTVTPVASSTQAAFTQASPPQAMPAQTIPTQGAPAAVAIRPGAALSIDAGQGRVVQLPGSATSVFAADPRVAEVRPASPTSLFVFGIAPGRTTIAAFDAAGKPITQYEVTVRPSAFGATEAQAAIARALPGASVRVEARPGGLTASGEVATPADAERVMSVLRSYLAEEQKADNRLTVLGLTQVNLRVRVAEVSRQVTRQFGINWQAFGADGLGSIGRIGRFATNVTSRNTLADPVNLPSLMTLGYAGAVNVAAMIDLLAQDNLITILAEPNLTAMSGETASFLAGGEFPIPVGRRDSYVTIEFKQFGISLAFVPTVMNNGRIHMRVKPEVSELSSNGAITLTASNSTLQIPAIAVRRAETTLELGSGESFAMAGLLQDNNRVVGRAIPGAGEIPVLGALFRSDNYQRNETELVIVVTPYIVRPSANRSELRTPLDGFTPPNDEDRILKFRQRGRTGPEAGALAKLPGDAGYILQ